jgi:hypothetical protein
MIVAAVSTEQLSHHPPFELSFKMSSKIKGSEIMLYQLKDTSTLTNPVIAKVDTAKWAREQKRQHR